MNKSYGITVLLKLKPDMGCGDGGRTAAKNAAVERLGGVREIRRKILVVETEKWR